MDTKKDGIVELVNNMILWTRNRKLVWAAYSAGETRIQTSPGFEIDGLVYVTNLNKQTFRIFKYRVIKSLFSSVLINETFTNRNLYRLQIYDLSKGVLFEFPPLSQLTDLYKEASLSVFDMSAFLEQLEHDAEKKDDSVKE